MQKTEFLTGFITKTNLKKVLRNILEKTVLVAPVRVGGDVVFQNIESLNEITFDYENCLNSPKDYLLLNDEILLKYDPKTLRIKKDNPDLAKIIVFGSRACDTKAIGLLDKFFMRKPKDTLYFKKRNNMLIITLVCNKLGHNCFCTSVNSGPYLEEGFDIQLVEVDGGYFLEAASFKGKEFVKRFSGLIGNADETKSVQKEAVVKKAIATKKKEFDFEKVYNNLDRLNVRDELWEDLSQRCQKCGGCFLICPTCSCFYVVDKKIDETEAWRVRSLDACFYEGFTRMAGGFNPIRPKEIMMKRKFYHKLWQQVNEFAELGCTGCGRCNEICPGNVNWLEVIKRIEKVSP